MRNHYDFSLRTITYRSVTGIITISDNVSKVLNIHARLLRWAMFHSVAGLHTSDLSSISWPTMMKLLFGRDVSARIKRPIIGSELNIKALIDRAPGPWCCTLRSRNEQENSRNTAKLISLRSRCCEPKINMCRRSFARIGECWIKHCDVDVFSVICHSL